MISLRFLHSLQLGPVDAVTTQITALSAVDLVQVWGKCGPGVGEMRARCGGDAGQVWARSGPLEAACVWLLVLSTPASFSLANLLIGKTD